MIFLDTKIMNKLNKKFLIGLSVVVLVIGSIFLYSTKVSAPSEVGAITLGNVAIGWQATSTTQGQIFPTAINGVKQAIVVGTTSPSIIGNLNFVLDASQYAGVDMCAKINAAYLALPSNGGKITVPTGRYDCTTPVVFGTNNKVVVLSGAGHGGPMGPYPAQVGGTTLYYSPSTGAAVTVDTNYSNAQSVIENISIQGSNGVSTRTSKGVVFGGSNGAFGGTLRDVHISGFGYGVYYDSYTSFMIIDASTIDFNGKNIYEPDTAGQNGENMRVLNSIIADSNNQGGGATDLYCIEVQESGNVQWNFVNTSIDDCSFYSNQFGGTGNINTFTNVHWENPNLHQYPYIQTLSNVDGVVTNLIGGDMMNDNTSGMTEFIINGGHVNIQGTSFVSNFNVSTPVTRVVTMQNATAVNTVSWSGAQETNAGVTYIYGTVPFSPQGYGTGLSMGPTITVGLPTASTNGTTTIANLGGVLDATSFMTTGEDVCKGINDAYASLPTKGGIIDVPRGYFECATMISMSTNGKRALLQGAPGGGTEIRWNGTATSTRINWGIQASGIDHTSGCGIKNITFKGSSYATSSNVQTGIDIGGSNGSDCTVFENVNIQEFGRGLYGGANVYHFAWYNGIIRANGMNILIDTANNSGEGYNFFNPFIIDAYATYGEEAEDCFVLSDYAAASVSVFGGSINSCQIKIGLQVLNFSLHGVHMENPSPDWPKYTWIEIADSQYTNLSIFGGTWVQNEVALRPDQFILSNGAGVYISGLTIFPTDGVSGTVTNLIVGGHAIWNGLNNTIGGVTNVISVSPFLYPFTRSGSSLNDSTNFGVLGIATSTPWAQLSINPNALGSGVPAFAIGSSTRTNFLVDGGGNVGIGTTTPTSQFHVEGSSAGIRLIRTGGSEPFIYMYNGSLSTGGQIRALVTQAGLRFTNDNAIDEWARFNGAGGFLVGTTTGRYLTVFASSTAPQISLSSGTAGVAQWTFRNAGGSFYIATTTVVGTATSTVHAFSIDSNGQPAFPYLASCGGLQTSAAGVVSCTSDEKLKDITGPYTRGLGAIMGITPQTFSYKKGTTEYDGVLYSRFIAQNVEKYIPEAVREGNAGKQVDQITLLATVVNAVNDLNKKVEQIPQYASETKKSVIDYWQWVVIGLLSLGFVYQQVQIRRLKRYMV